MDKFNPFVMIDENTIDYKNEYGADIHLHYIFSPPTIIKVEIDYKDKKYQREFTNNILIYSIYQYIINNNTINKEDNIEETVKRLAEEKIKEIVERYFYYNIICEEKNIEPINHYKYEDENYKFNIHICNNGDIIGIDSIKPRINYFHCYPKNNYYYSDCRGCYLMLNDDQYEYVKNKDFTEEAYKEILKPDIIMKKLEENYEFGNNDNGVVMF